MFSAGCFSVNKVLHSVDSITGTKCTGANTRLPPCGRTCPVDTSVVIFNFVRADVFAGEKSARAASARPLAPISKDKTTMTRWTITILTALLLLFGQYSNGQTKDEKKDSILIKNIGTFQFLGDLGMFGGNYERIFTRKTLINFSFRNGIGIIPGDIESNISNVLITMTGMNLLVGKKIALETGVYPGFWFSKTTYFVATVDIGVRYQNRNGGFFYRLAFNPIIYPTDKSTDKISIIPFTFSFGKCF